MYKTENQCVDCGLPCLGSACRYRNVRVSYCDRCGDEGADYRIDGEDYCEDCAKKYIQEAFDDLSLMEQADILDIDVQSTEDVMD